jgi:hypothetical protein
LAADRQIGDRSTVGKRSRRKGDSRQRRRTTVSLTFFGAKTRKKRRGAAVSRNWRCVDDKLLNRVEFDGWIGEKLLSCVEHDGAAEVLKVFVSLKDEFRSEKREHRTTIEVYIKKLPTVDICGATSFFARQKKIKALKDEI